MATTASKKPAGPIPLDYFKGRDPLERWKLRLSGLALLLVAIWAVAGFIWSAWGNRQSSPGPVAAVHAAWETQCTGCHVPFQPIRRQFWLSSAHDSDQKCQVCHAGPAHHESQIPELACASCHREHRGSEASLVRIPDSACTQCHANLADHVKTSAERVVVPVERSFTQEALDHVKAFDQVNHPEFQSAAKDPGKLAFNHQLHMSPGMDVKNKGDPKWTFVKMPTADWKRYGKNPSKHDVVQLECSSCHCLDSGDFQIPDNRLEGVPASVLRPRSPGAYFLPITYENQCRPCHVLTVRVVDDPRSPEIVIPHRLQPNQVHDFLWGVLVNHYDDGKHLEHFQKKLSNLLAKEKMAEENQNDSDPEKRIEFLFQKKVERIERILYPEKQTCGECHQYALQEGRPVPKAIEPADVPEVWLQRALFNHAAHRAVACLECHQEALSSDKSDDVLLPKIKDCVKCHAPGKGARFDCTECHRYHDGAKHRRDGAGLFFGALGSSQRDPKNKMSIEQILNRP